MKPTSTYKYLRVSYIINRVSFLHVHVSATLVAILRKVAETYFGFISVSNQLNA